MRGKEIRLSSQSLFSGITPAYAGKSTSEKLYALGLKDHPRVCGEKHTYQRKFFYEEGSPPRMRGKEYLGGGRYHVNRITPAYAGKRRTGTSNLGCHQDHPRVCGEKTKKIP